MRFFFQGDFFYLQGQLSALQKETQKPFHIMINVV